jgi:pimeloyl-ACP methyl ester carboxylesterase
MAYTEHRYTSHDGLTLYYRSYGQGDSTLLCLPGLSRNCKDFEEIAERFSDRWRVITPDLRGRGQSGWDPKPSHYNPGVYVRDTWKLLDDLDIRQVALIGTSLGGLMAFIMGDQQPERLRGVIINDVGPEVPAEAVSRILQYVGRTPPAPGWQAAAASVREAYDLAMPGMSEQFWMDYTRKSRRENPDGSIVPDMDPAIGDALRKSQWVLKILRFLRKIKLLKKIAGVKIDPWDSFRSMTMPTLLIRGELSDVLLPDTVQRMQVLKPDLAVVTVADRGHAPLLDEPEAAGAIDTFLESL